jgi:hypothetical protein
MQVVGGLEPPPPLAASIPTLREKLHTICALTVQTCRAIEPSTTPADVVFPEQTGRGGGG